MIERRRILTFSAVCFAAVAAPREVWLADWLGGTGTDGNGPLACGSAVAIGRECLELVSVEVRDRLIKRVGGLLDLQTRGFIEAARAALRELRRQDFELRRTLNVRGWILAETEVGLWLATAMRGGARGLPERRLL